jgi:PAS domain S-box-containing protein
MNIERLPDGALAEVLEAAPDGVVMVGPDGSIEYVNRAIEELFGYTRDELIGVVIERLIPGRLRGGHVSVRAEYQQHPRRRPAGPGLRLQALRKDGSEVPVEISLAPVTVGEHPSVVATVRDATEQRKLEDERVSDARAGAVEEIVGTLDVIVWESMTPDRQSLTYLGGRTEMLLGYPRARWLAPGFWMSLIHPDDRMAALTFFENGREKDSFDLTYRAIAADGEIHELRDIVSVTRGPDREIRRLQGVITNITERRVASTRLDHAHKMEAVGQLAGGIAHDFNNLLTIVSGYARRLSRHPGLADARPDLEQILAASDRAAELTRQLLRFARRGRTDAALLDVGAVVSELEPMLRRLLAADIELAVTPAGGLPSVLMDRAGLEQIVMNLVINASDAMPSGGKLSLRTAAIEVDETQAAVHGATGGRYLRLTVTDTGSGIAPEMMERIFEPFVTTKGDRGSGLGLVTVAATVEQAGGWIDVESAVGKGTVLTVMLPGSGSAAEPAGDTDGARRTTVLLVEDEPALRTLVATMLSEQGYAVLRAGDGDEAITVAERHSGTIDLLVTDIVMPRRSGPELAAQLRGQLPGLEVLFMSGYNDSRLVSRGIEEAKVNLLVKPFTPDQLIARVGELTARVGQGASE